MAPVSIPSHLTAWGTTLLLANLLVLDSSAKYYVNPSLVLSIRVGYWVFSSWSTSFDSYLKISVLEFGGGLLGILAVRYAARGAAGATQAAAIEEAVF